MATNVEIENLCDDILLEIFSYLSVQDIAGSVQHVCSRWREICFNSQLWKDLSYRPGRYDDEEDIINILKSAPKLESIQFNQVVVGSKMIRTLADNCFHIKKLELGELAVSHELLRDVQKNCPRLEHLAVRETTLHDIKNGEIISQFQNLKSLIFLRDPFATESLNFKPLAEGCPNLEHLDITNTLVKIEGLEYLLVKKKDNLKYLGISCRTGGHCILPLFCICSQLNTLHINSVCHSNNFKGLRLSENSGALTTFRWTHLGTADVNQIIQIFRNNSLHQLTELSITDYCKYEDKLANVIIHYCPLLKKLHLPQCFNLTDESLKNLHFLRCLRSVDFCASKITDCGIMFLVMCEQLRYVDVRCCYNISRTVLLTMTKLKKLQVLILDGCYIDGITLDIIPDRLRTLNRLSICNCHGIEEDAVDQLRNKMPLLRVAR